MNAPAPSRSFGVTAAAIVALLGSLVFLLLATIMFATAFMQLPGEQVPGYRGIAIGTAAMMAGLAILGVVTAVGLLKVKPWARTATIAIAVLLVIMGAFGTLVAIVVPLPVSADVPGADAAMLASAKGVMVAAFFIPLVVGVWWLVLFNRPSVKAAFEAGAPPVEGAVPVSVLLAAWISIIGGVGCLIPILMQMPAFLFGVTFEGMAAGVVYAIMGAVSIYVGKGLLALDETARKVCIGWYAVTTLHTALITYVPSMKAKMLAAQAAMQPDLATPVPGEDAVMTIAFVGVVLVSILAIAFLHRHRALFH